MVLYTQEQLEKANNTDLEEYLLRRGEKLKRTGKESPIRYQSNNLPPFAMWLAFPASDYYGGSVAVPDIQCHLPRFSHLGFITTGHCT